MSVLQYQGLCLSPVQVTSKQARDTHDSPFIIIVVIIVIIIVIVYQMKELWSSYELHLINYQNKRSRRTLAGTQITTKNILTREDVSTEQEIRALAKKDLQFFPLSQFRPIKDFPFLN